MTGRETKHKPEYNEQARKLCALGAKDEEIADFFNVAKSTINLWKLDRAGFSDSLKLGKELFDDETVVNSLLHSALGYSHKEDKILSNPQNPESPIIVKTTKHYPPNATSLIFWLKNRQPKKWRDRPDEGGSDDSKALDAINSLIDKLPN